MNRNRKILKVTAAAVCTAMTLQGAVPAWAVEMPEKDENVYVNLEQNGSVSGIYVINEYKLDQETDIVDYGAYSEIRNLTTEEELAYSDGEVSFTAPEGKFFYQGNLDSGNLPWNISIKYELDGTEFSAEELAGKSGKLKITLGIAKNPEAEAYFFENYLIQATVTLNTKTCKNIQAEKATQANVGNDRQLLYNIMAGQEKEVVITADVTEFEMDPISFQAVPMSFDIDGDSLDKESLYEKMDEIKDAAGEFDDGAEELSSGSSELKEGTTALADGDSELQDGIRSLKSGSWQILKGLETLDGGAGSLKSGTQTLFAGSSKLKNGVEDLNSGIAELKAGADALEAGGTDAAVGSAQVASGAAALKNGLSSMGPGAGQIREGLAELEENAEVLTGSSAMVLEALETIQSSLNSIEVGSEQINSLLNSSAGMLQLITDTDTKTGALAEELSTLQSSYSDQKGIPASDTEYAEYLESVAAKAESIYNSNQAAIDLVAGQNGIDVSQSIANIRRIAQLLLENGQLLSALMDGTDSSSADAASLRQQTAVLASGYNEFYSAVQSILVLLQSMITEKMEPLKSAIDTLTAQYAALDEGIGTYTDAVAGIAEGYERLYAGVQEVIGGAENLSEGAEALAKGNSSLADGAQNLQAGVKELQEGGSNLEDGTSSLSAGAEEVVKGASSLKAGSSTLTEGAADLYSGAAELYDGSSSLHDGITALDEGAAALADGVSQLKEGTAEFKSQTDTIDETVDEEIDQVIQKLAGSDFEAISFVSEKNENIGLVQFVMKTEGIEKEEEETEAKMQETESETALEKIKGLFQK